MARISQFNAVCEAFEVLSDTKLRQIYDTKGHTGLSNGFTEDGEEFAGYIYLGDAFEIFKRFFGSENPWSTQLAPKS
jgi:DnaJ-class molecular chaperone